MNDYEQRMKALDVLKDACEKVTDAMNAIEKLSEACGIKKDKISVNEMAYAVGKITGKSPFCVEEILRATIKFMVENEVHDIYLGEEDEDDE